MYGNFTYKREGRSDGSCRLKIIRRGDVYVFIVEQLKQVVRVEREKEREKEKEKQEAECHSGDICHDITDIACVALDLAYINMVMDYASTLDHNRAVVRKEKRAIMDKAIWIEHYPAGTNPNPPCFNNQDSYAIVAFDDHGNPVWSYASKEDVLRATGLTDEDVCI
jgi:hypothetical protein